jgi:transposase
MKSGMKMNKKELMGLEKEAMLDLLLTVITAQAAEIAELKARLGQNSGNSGKPPSSDGLGKATAKPDSKEGGRKAGGQPGHKGHGLKIEREPDREIAVEPTECPKCGSSLEGMETYHVSSRYVYDIEITMNLTKYNIEGAECPGCGSQVIGEAPRECRGTVNYGNGVRTLGVLLTQYGYVSVDKTQKILGDLLGVPISSGTIKGMQREFALKTEPTVAKIKKKLLESEVLNVDETGGRVAGKTQWFHVASNTRYTLLTVHGKRGKAGSESGGVLGEYEGTLVHDCWKPYFGFDRCEHAVCCAHLLRELTACIEAGHMWAIDMWVLLMEMKGVVDRYKDDDKAELSRYYTDKFKSEYDKIIEAAKAEIVPSQTRKKSKAENLLVRLELYRNEITRFTRDFDVPFTNNQAERDLRCNKVKQKVSGCFRTDGGAVDFANTSSFIGTVKKFGLSVANAIRSLFDGHDVLFPDPTE